MSKYVDVSEQFQCSCDTKDCGNVAIIAKVSGSKKTYYCHTHNPIRISTDNPNCPTPEARR